MITAGLHLPVLGLRMLSSTGLPLYELDISNIMKSKGKLRPFENPRGFTKDPRCLPRGKPPNNMRFSGWRLAHAVKKADYLKRPPFWFLSQVGFFLEQMSTLDWRQDNLRLFKGMSRAYPDFTGTSLAGRIGQGVAILFMEDAGYAFVGHYPRSASKPGPDFVFENNSGVHALVEAKGSFVKPAREQNIKGKLRGAVSRLRAARKVAHNKSYAIATYLREVGDTHTEPSLVAFVDPKRKRAKDANDQDPDRIRRENYAAWLDAMGLFESASDLRERRGRVENLRLTLPTLDVIGRRFALAITSLHPRTEQMIGVLGGPWPFWGSFMFDVVGIETGNLRVIEKALTIASGNLFSEIQPLKLNATKELDRVDGFSGSILSDGTLLGELGPWTMHNLPTETFTL